MPATDSKWWIELDWRWRWFKITWRYRLGRIVCVFKGHKWYQFADPNDPMQQPYLYDLFCERCSKFGATPPNGRRN